jgi:large subunit ribosomal protein L1
MQRSKTYRAASETFDKNEIYAPLAAIKIAKDTSKKKFDETVDVVMRLGVDPRKADQMVRGTVNLPHGTGKTARVLVFANADKAEAAREAGADTSVATSSSTRWPAAGSTSTPSSRPPT